MTTTSHRDCPHPATKAARAICRKARASQAAHEVDTLTAIRDSYFAGADLEEIAARVNDIRPDLAAAYYDNSLDIEGFIASLA